MLFVSKCEGVVHAACEKSVSCISDSSLRVILSELEITENL